MKGYVQLRRGLLEHFKVMSASEIKIYIGVLILANFKSAIVNITLAELSEIVSLDKKIVLNSLHRLDKFGYVKYTPAKNQWHANSIEIINYNGSVKNTTLTPIATPIATPTPTPIPIPIANAVSPCESRKLQIPKKYKEVLRSINKNKEVEVPTTQIASLLLKTSFLDQLKKIYPELNLEAEIKSCVAWNMSRGKKDSNWERRIQNWLRIAYENKGVVGVVKQEENSLDRYKRLQETV